MCPRGTFYHGPLLQHNGQECRTALEYDEAMLATREFWFKHPVRYDRDWHDTLSAYRRCVPPWPPIPEPTEQDYIEHLLLTKDSAPGPGPVPNRRVVESGNGGCPGGTLVPFVEVRHFQFCIKKYRYHARIVQSFTCFTCFTRALHAADSLLQWCSAS